MSEITLGRYIFERLSQLDIKTIFGLPGDFNLALLDKIYEVDGLRWAGNANELNAAYAADGYARVKGTACLITTFGVGELSALNGVAGSYAEHVPVVHIVGVPSLDSQKNRLLLHHTLGNGDFHVFSDMSKSISKTLRLVNDVRDAPAVIDLCLRDAHVYQRPVYIALPTNLVEQLVPTALLDTPINLKRELNPKEAEDEVISTVLELIGKAQNPVILVDACCIRHHCRTLTQKLIDATQFPTFVTPMGKSAVDETNPRFGGVYVGTLSNPDVKAAVESADLILSVGALLSDFNTGSFSYAYKTRDVVEFHSDYTQIRSAVYRGVQMKYTLERLLGSVADAAAGYKPVPVPSVKLLNTPAPAATPLTQEWLWTRVSSFFHPGDVVLSETGTSAFGVVQSRFPPKTVGISQVLWGSIGYTVGSTLGAAFAAAELDKDKRVVLFVGDGSLQLTVQEISTMIRWGLKPYLFVLNNDGYTIERLIHGPTAGYNNIQSWDHSKLLEFFGAKPSESEYHAVHTTGDAEKLFSSAAFNKNDKIRLIELFLPKMDAPSNLVKQAEITAHLNAG